MTPLPDRLLVTGALGFIGSAFVRRLAPKVETIVNIDAGTYAADPERLAGLDNVQAEPRDIADGNLDGLFGRFAPQVVVHFAAETHVTRSELDEETFFTTNVDGTTAVMDAARAAGTELVVHVSTDEVYGSALDHPFREDEKEPGEGRATSAYARSKAVADDVALSYRDQMKVVVVRPTNCFGPWQHPEKAIPRWTTRALAGARLPVWGDGQYVRDWMYVDDVASAIELLIQNADQSDVYNIGPSGETITNLEIAHLIARAVGVGDDAVYLTEYDRPHHDRRYSVDSTKIRALGWQPETSIEQGIHSTVEWYREHRRWWEPLTEDAESLYLDAGEREDA